MVFFSFFKREKSWKEGIEVDKQNINQSMQQSFGPDFSKWSPLRRGAYTRGRTYVAAPPPPPAAAVPRHFTQREAPNLICPASENPRIDFIRSGLLFEVHSSKLFFFFLDR